MENLLGEMMLGGLGSSLLFCPLPGGRATGQSHFGIGGWFLALALSLRF